MSAEARSYSGTGATLLGCVTGPMGRDTPPPSANIPNRKIAPELLRSLAEVKGQVQFLLYLADQIEDWLGQLSLESDPGQSSFLGKILSMYSNQMENKHQGLGDRIAETCQEVYVTVREFDVI